MNGKPQSVSAAHITGAHHIRIQTGEGRILTTHTGSLPRPASLRRLLVQRTRGKSVDEAMLEAEIRAAKQWAVQAQRAAGIDESGI